MNFFLEVKKCAQTFNKIFVRSSKQHFCKQGVLAYIS